MSTIPRVSSAISGEPAHFGSVLAHQPQLAARFAALYGALWDSDVVSAETKELCRMRNARITACGFCRQVRFAKPLAAGLGEDLIDEVTDDYAASTKLSDAQKAALRFTNALIHDPEFLDVSASTALTHHFTQAQIAELTIAVTLFLALAKVLITLGLEPESLDVTVIPTPAPTAAAMASGVASLGDSLDLALAARPELLAGFQAFYGGLWEQDALAPALLDDLRRRIEAQHTGAATVDAIPPELTAYADLIPFAHHAITDDQAAAVRATLGDPGYVAFSIAVALFDALYRAREVLGRVEAVPA